MNDDKIENEYTDEDVAELEAWLDGFIKELNSHKKPGTYMVNFEKLGEMKLAYRAIKRALKNTGFDGEITCEQNELEPFFGSIRVEGVAIDISEGEDFAYAASLAANVEVYPLIDNKVRMSFTFYGLTKRID